MINFTVYTSLIMSIIIQVITGVIEVFSLFVNLPSKFAFLKQMMLLEVFVQFIEGSFYIYWFNNFNNVANITPSRYFDWVITTPTMLVNLVFYLIFLQKLDNNTSDQLNFFEVLLGVLLGFIPFLIYYYMIYDKYALLSEDGYKIFMYFFIFWSLYGVAAILPYKIKNTCYNILDLFAKNFFGVFLSYLIFTNMY